MKKIFSIILVLSLTILSAFGQDARQRTTETIVADVLAQLPAQNSNDFNKQIADLASCAPESVKILASMMTPPEKGANNLIEYALFGLVSYVSDPAHNSQKDVVLKALQEAAEQSTDATAKAFLQSIQWTLLPENAPAQATPLTLKTAKSLMNSGQSPQRYSATYEYLKAKPADASKILVNALKEGDRKYSNAVIGYATEVAGVEALVPAVSKAFAKLGDGSKTDVLNWIGNNKISSMLGIAYENMGVGGEVADAAIIAVGKIGDEKAPAALVSLLGGSNDKAAMTALKAVRGDIQTPVLEAISNVKSADALKSLFALASAKRMSQAAPAIFEAINSSDKEISSSALASLAGVVGTGDIAKVGALLDNAKSKEIAPLRKALVSALHTLPASDQYTSVSNLIASAKNAERFYPALANTGSEEAVEVLAKAYNEKSSAEALEALLSIDNAKAAPVLLAVAKNDASIADKVLPRYTSLVQKYEKSLDKKRVNYASAISLASSAKVKNTIVKAISNVPTMKAFLLAGKSLDDPQTAVNAAYAVKNIARTTNEEIDYEALKTNLTKAAEVLANTGDSDDSYAVNEINMILSKAAPAPKSELTAQEKKQGFEMLFDGTDLSKWQGDFDGYTPVNGSIYVSAGYGSTGNLYTKKEYRNFVLRFEFCFLRAGVNNGVGIRTPMGVDAAYDAMCEVQILDHDAPMYKNLREYQVHGSVYGIIPAKRVVHKPLGEWSTEEIRVEGDHITVTVNGEVILDGNVRRACKGHNVAPDGSNKNPYTVDHKNHPGLFNKTGFISFCGHGSGLKLRNVRVLDLDK